MTFTIQRSKRLVLNFSLSCLLASITLALIAFSMQLASDHVLPSLYASTPRTLLTGTVEAVSKKERSVLDFFGHSVHSKKLRMTDADQKIQIDLTCNGIELFRLCYVKDETPLSAKIEFIEVPGSNWITSLTANNEMIVNEEKSEKNFNYFMKENEIGKDFLWFGSALFFLSSIFYGFIDFFDKKRRMEK